MSDEIVEFHTDSSVTSGGGSVPQLEHGPTDRIEPVEVNARGDAGAVIASITSREVRNHLVRARGVRRGDLLTGGVAWSRITNPDGTCTIRSQDNTILWEGWPDTVVALRERP